MSKFEKRFSEVSLDTVPWLIATIWGHPGYNILAYFICAEYGFFTSFEDNVSQVNAIAYSLVLIPIFIVRSIVFKLYYHIAGYRMNIWYFIELFTERHKFQIISLLSFFLLLGKWEANIIGFVVLPIALLFTLVFGLITFIRVLTVVPLRKKENDD